MTQEMTYEQAMARLEQITKQMESGEMPIDQMAAALKEARQLVAFCNQQLLDVEADIKAATE